MKTQTVTFKHDYYDMAGILFFPDNFDEGKTYPAIVISAPAGAVKEQAPSFYAKKLAEKGWISLVFDTSFQAESGGNTRYLEHPFVRVEDVKCAVDYLTTLDFVDNAKIGALGICSGAGYVFNAAMTDKRLKAIAGVSTSDPGAWIREGLQGEMTLEMQLGLLEEASQQRTAEANGASPVYGPYVPDEISDDMPNTLKEANNYYRTDRASHPRSENKVSLLSVDKLFAFDTFNFADRFLTQPILLVAGEEADTIAYSENLYQKAASQQKELFTIPGATHVALYDQDIYVDPAVAKLNQFFTDYLG